MKAYFVDDFVLNIPLLLANAVSQSNESFLQETNTVTIQTASIVDIAGLFVKRIGQDFQIFESKLASAAVLPYQFAQVVQHS